MILWIILAVIIGGLVGFGITYLVCRKLPQEKIRQLNQEIIDKEQQKLENIRRDFEIIISEQNIKLLSLEQEIKDSYAELDSLATQKILVKDAIEDLQEQAQKSASKFYDSEMALAIEKLDHALESAAVHYQNAEEEYRQHYLSTVGELAQQLSIDMVAQRSSYQELETKLAQLRTTVNAAVAAAKRQEELNNEQDFYRLVLPDSDIQEIAYLRQVEPFLRDKEALNKVIWKVYYEKPYTDLVGRVLGNSVKTGIYKITNIQNQMCYVGQAVDVASRFRQHIKRAVGAEAPTRNKLYPAMNAAGPENFTFELIEECDRSKLDKREDYWQDFYEAKTWGYSIK